MDIGQNVGAYIGLGYLVAFVVVLLVAVAIARINESSPTAEDMLDSEEQPPIGYEAPFPSPMRELTPEECRMVQANPLPPLYFPQDTR